VMFHDGGKMTLTRKARLCRDRRDSVVGILKEPTRPLEALGEYVLSRCGSKGALERRREALRTHAHQGRQSPDCYPFAERDIDMVTQQIDFCRG